MSLLINEKLAQSYATLKWYCSDLCSHKCCVLIAVNVNDDVCFVIKLCFGFHFLFSVCSFSGEQWLSLCPLETDSFPPMCESNIQELGLALKTTCYLYSSTYCTGCQAVCLMAGQPNMFQPARVKEVSVGVARLTI